MEAIDKQGGLDTHKMQKARVCRIFRRQRSYMFGIDEILGEKPTAEATLTLLKPVMMIQQRIVHSCPGKGFRNWVLCSSELDPKKKK